MIRFPHNRDALILACAVWGIHVPLEMWVAGRFLWVALLWAAHGLALTLALGWALTRVFEFRSRAVRIAACVALPVLLAAVQTVLDLATTYWVGHRLLGEIKAPSPIDVLFNDPRYKGAGQMTFVVYLWPFGFYAVALSLLAAARQAYEARLQALRLQVNPHFLFNALNSISAVIVLGRHKEAEEMTLSLARFYRGSLMAEDDQTSDLGEELDSLDAYVELEQIRLGDALQLTVDCPDDLLTARLPPRLLQPLVENAIKHGQARASDELTVSVTVRAAGERLEITVINPIGAAPNSVEGTGTGLANVRRRLHAAYGRRAVFAAAESAGEWRVRVSLPLDQGG